jgi:septum formation protein
MLILASESPRRKQILESLDLTFKVIPSNADESFNNFFPVEYIPLILAKKKAEKVASIYSDDTIIGADTVVILDGKIFNKPKSKQDAEKILRALSGNTHKVITGVCIKNISENLTVRFSETSFVTFKKLNNDIIKKYMDSVNVMDKAGAYAVQEYGSIVIESFSGSMSNIMGFPIEKFQESLIIFPHNFS